MRRDPGTALDILVACRRAMAFTAGMTYEAFAEDLKTQSAVIHQLLIIGEATTRLSKAFRARHPRIPWSQMRGTRNHMIHAYDDVDVREVWDTITRDIPRLRRHLEELEARGWDTE